MKRKLRAKLRQWLGLGETEKLLALHIKRTRDFMEEVRPSAPPATSPQPGELITPTEVKKGYGGHN